MKCRTVKCDNEGGKRSGYCPNCQSGFYYWTKKRPAQVLERRLKLSIFSSRVETVMTKRGIYEKK